MISNQVNAVFPRPLKVVAYLFIVGGIFSVLDFVVGLVVGRITFNLGVLYLLIGWGLLGLNARWLPWAVFCTWLGLIFTIAAAVAWVFTPISLQHFKILGFHVGQAPPGFGFAVITAVFALLCWQNGVLKSRSVRLLFS